MSKNEANGNVQRNVASHKNKQLKLISVGFKEASVDSPAFRAHVNFFHTRMEIFDDRLQTTIAFYDQKFKTTFDDFQRVGETVVSLAFPSPVILANGLVSNQAFTPSVVSESSKEYKNFFDFLIKIVIGTSNSRSKIIVDLMSNVIEPYKSKRKNFEYFQTKYDNMLNAFQDIKVTNKLLDPQTIRNDAQQLHEVRKSYLAASLDLIEAISEVKLKLEKHFLDSISVLISKAHNTLSNKNPDIGLFLSGNSKYFNDYKVWVENAIEGNEALKNDMQHARNQVFEYASKFYAPSQDINDYDITNIHNAVEACRNLPIPSVCPEKSGWLHMKTLVGKDNREIWVRRWCFLQNGVFGIFLLSPSKIYVEETDKFGIFLIQVRHAMEENRKYCFEVKIINGSESNTDTVNSNYRNNSKNNITIIFQTETLKDLESWLNTFELSKKYIGTLDNSILAHEIAYKRFSPRFFEFASSTTTSIDQALTTFDSETISLLDELDCTFSEYEVLTLPDGKLFEFHMDTTPITTKLSQLAILANYFTRGSWFPNAILVNIWGTTNWSEYSLCENKQMRSSTVIDMAHNRLSMVNSEIFPTFYDRQLQVDDLQMKAMFYVIDQRLLKMKTEFLLFKFSSFWYPNAKQRFPCICYVTKDYLFCYMNSMGFICLTRLNTGDIISVEIDKDHSNRIILYDFENIQYKLDVLFTDRKAVVLKLKTLIENKVSHKMTNLEDIFKRFVSIDLQVKESKELDKSEMDAVDTIQVTEVRDVVTGNQTNELNLVNSRDFKGTELLETTMFWKMCNVAELLSRLRDFKKKSSIVHKYDYDIPSKGLVHILFGDSSTAFPRCFFLASSDITAIDISFWKQELSKDNNAHETILTRYLRFPIDVTHYLLHEQSKSGKRMVQQKSLCLKQSIIKAVENVYYEVEQGPVYIKLPMCNYLRAKLTYCITQNFSPKDHIEVKLKMSTSGSVIQMFYRFDFINRQTGEIIPEEKWTYLEKMLLDWSVFLSNVEFSLVKKVIRYYLEKIGNHGKVIKAMKLCGLIGVDGEDDDKKKEKVTSKEENEEEEGKDQDYFRDKGGRKGDVIPEKYLVRYSFMILIKIFWKHIMYRTANIGLVFFRFGISLVIFLKKIMLNLNKILLIGLLLSILVSVFLGGRSTLSYWAVRRAKNTFSSYMEQFQRTHEDMTTNKKNIVYLNDLEALTQDLLLESDNLVYQEFKKQLDNVSTINKYQSVKDDVAMRRNELLVELKLLQNMEREVIQGDYREFLLEETSRCYVIKSEMKDLYEDNLDLQKYCDECYSELGRLTELLL